MVVKLLVDPLTTRGYQCANSSHSFSDYKYEGNYQLRINVLIANIKESFSPSV